MSLRPTSIINGIAYPPPTATAQTVQAAGDSSAHGAEQGAHPGLDSLLQLAARLASAPCATILDPDHPGNHLAGYSVNIPLIARNGRHLGHLCLNPKEPLTCC